VQKKQNKKNLPYDYIWSREKPISFTTESYQKILANLEYVNVDKKYKVIQVTSSISSEGKTTFFSNIAYLLAQKKLKTILIDLDLRKPKVHKIYNCPNDKGVTEVLSGRSNLEESIRKNKSYGFDVLTSGERTNAVVNLIQSNKMKDLIKELRKTYDYVLIDSPPVINVSDALYISKFTDGVIFVIAQSKTRRGIIKEAVNLLKRNKVDIIGSAITQVDIKRSRYGYGYGYGYGYSYEYEEPKNDLND